MAAITTRISISGRGITADRLASNCSFTVIAESILERGTKVITSTDTASPNMVADAANFGGANNRALVYLKNTSTTKDQYVYIHLGGTRIFKLNTGEATIFPWEADAGTDDIEAHATTNTNTIEYTIINIK